MSTRRMRWIDHWIGMPICFALGLLRRILRPRHSHPAPFSGRRPIAIFKFFGLGSIIQATPMLRSLRQRHPGAPLVFVTFSANQDLLEQLGIADQLLILRTRSLCQFTRDVTRAILLMRRQRVEAVIDLEFFSKFSTLLAVFCGAKRRIAFHLNDFWRYSLVTDPIYFNYYHHVSDLYFEAAKRLNAEMVDPSLSPITVAGEARASVNRFLDEAGASAQRIIGVNVNAGDVSLERRWPPANFRVVIETLLERHDDVLFLLTGAPNEAAYVRGVHDQLRGEDKARVIVTAGRWSLGEFVAGLSRMTLFITNDSGPMHLAAAQGVPVVSIWGPGRPAFYAPRTPHHESIYENYPCSPCLYMFTTFEGMWCNHEGWCMAAIEPGRVLEAAERMLAGRPAARNNM